LKPFEERFFTGNKERDAELKATIRAVFSSPSGKAILNRLISAAPPLGHSENMTPHLHGNCEVVALLTRFGTAAGLPENQPQ
jgi:hypothetical protein